MIDPLPFKQKPAGSDRLLDYTVLEALRAAHHHVLAAGRCAPQCTPK